MIRLTAVGKRFGSQELFSDVSLTIKYGDRVGLVGANGAGKTTLLKILSGDVSCDEGSRTMPQGFRVGLMRQEVGALESSTRLLDFAVGGAEHIVALHDKIEEVVTKLESATPEEAEELVHHLHDAQEAYAVADGYSLEGNAKAILSGLGFTNDDYDSPLGSFSGGWRMRGQLARLLVSAPDLLLLDEPTNHLDLESAVWLENFLVNYEKGLLIISHDRYFLNRMVNAIAEVEKGRLTYYPYPFDRYLEEKQIRIEMSNATADRQDKEIARQERFIERFKAKASKAKAAQSRQKQLDKIERVERITGDNQKVGLRFAEGGRVGATPLEMTDATAGYGDKAVFTGLTFTLRRGDRIALLGVNGAGKSTLLKALSRQIPLMDGDLRIAESVQLAYFAQSQTEALDLDSVVLDAVTAAIPFESVPRARAVLGALGLGGNDVDKKIKVLSGGEKSRVALSIIALTPTNLLLLDEPTNHLDLVSREALERSLTNYSGAVVFVSHDRAFIDTVATKIVYLDHGSATEFLGDYAYFEAKRKEIAEAKAAWEAKPKVKDESAPTKKESRKEAAKRRADANKRLTPAQKELTAAEKRIAALEGEMAELEQTMADPKIHDNPKAVVELSKELAAHKDEHEKLLARWEELGEQVENMMAEIDG